MGGIRMLALLFISCQVTIAVRQCYVFPIPHAGGKPQVLDCTTNPGHDYAASGCFYRRYTDDSGLQAGFVEGGCGASMCRTGKEQKCRDITESEAGFSMNSKFCCCYEEKCNTLMKAETLA